MEPLGEFLRILRDLPYLDWRDVRNTLTAPEMYEGTFEEWKELYDVFIKGEVSNYQTIEEIKAAIRQEYIKVQKGEDI